MSTIDLSSVMVIVQIPLSQIYFLSNEITPGSCYVAITQLLWPFRVDTYGHC